MKRNILNTFGVVVAALVMAGCASLDVDRDWQATGGSKSDGIIRLSYEQTEFERGNVNYNGGIFKNLYNQQNQSGKERSETGLAGIFKSTSGWDDGKYYCLHNTAPAGSIVKITNTANGKAVYAKVLDLIPDLKQNNNLVVRLSNAAATELGITEKLYALSVRGSFYDFFLEFNNFEIGLSSVLEMEINFEKDIKPLVARDKALESSHFVSIPLKQKEIQKFVKNNKFIPHGLYVLERILLRENVHI